MTLCDQSHEESIPHNALEHSEEGHTGRGIAQDVPRDDGTDEVVREIDVFLSPALSQKTYLMQYPGQPESSATPSAAVAAATATATNKLCVPIEARIKPRHGLIHAEHAVSSALPTATPYGSSLMRTFESQTIPVTTHLCLGKLVLSGAPLQDDDDMAPRDALHLIPLTHITQMRPSFSQLDEGDHAMDEEKDESAKARQQPIGFTRKESDRAAAARKSSYAYKKASQEAEAWIDLTVATSDSTPDATSNRLDDAFDSTASADTATPHVLSQIHCPAPHQVIWSPPTDESSDHAARYIQTLNYIPTTASSALSHNVAGAESSSLLKAVIVKTTNVLQQTGGPVPFSILLGQFGNQVSVETVVRALNVCAVLVRGNWCLHSKFLVMATTYHKAVPTDRTASLATLQQMRTFLLLLLQDEGVIDRPRLLHVYGNGTDSDDPANDTSTSNSAMPQRITSLLQLVAKKQTVTPGSVSVISQRSGWVLKIDDDVGFLQKHADVVTLHEAYWGRQRQRYTRELELYRNAPVRL